MALCSIFSNIEVIAYQQDQSYRCYFSIVSDLFRRDMGQRREREEGRGKREKSCDKW